MGPPKGWRLRQIASRQLEEIEHRLDQNTFNKWLAAARSSKNSLQTDLPSSQIPSQMSFITPESPQLFVVIDTCSLVKYRREFIDYVTYLKLTFSNRRSPIKFLISLTVLEELDKCNRSNKRRGKIKSETEQQSNKTNSCSLSTVDTDVLQVMRAAETGGCDIGDRRNSNLDPPRMFMRFLEEEMRMSNVLIGELDPLKKVKLEESFETLNKDDRILECCLRSRMFISIHDHHKDTKVILITEDNLFKSKSTTFRMPSFRWAEFKLKFKNFGLANYVPTPLLPVFGQNNINTSSTNNNNNNKQVKKGAAISNQARLSNIIKQTFSNTSEDDSVVFIEEIINVK